MCDMPRLSLFKPEKGNDYKFHDRNINEMFQVGGTDLNLHKYIGPYDQGETNKDGDASPTQPNYSGSEINELTIQDLLFLENRDRKYAPDVYTIRGIYNVQDADFNLSQFGMFLQNDTLFLTVHLNDTVERLGRKPMSGDVIEFPHMKDDYSLDKNIPIALKRFYVVEDVNRAAEGFSQTWWPHLLRLKMKTLVDSQEFRDILGDATTDGSLASYMSSFNKEKQINDAIVNQAEADAPKSGFNYKQYYVTPIDEKGNVRLDNVNNKTDRVSNDKPINSTIDTPASSSYGFYYDGDGVAPNGYPTGFGTSFPTTNKNKGDYFLRTDFLPNRLFRYDGTRWIKVEDSIRLTTTNNDTRKNFKSQFVNTSGTKTINGLTVEQRQSLSDALKPKADN
jgi:hypothetical protein|tara:strand:- start:147 stop:1325 length:1179 start_codon:yes stop_codon:yes gene_type:complete